VKAATAEDARIVRIENGRPRYGEEILETSLPQETQQMQAVSFNKGCYLGQEIVERIRARGHVNRLLQRVDLAELVEPGTKLDIEGKEATVMSSVWSPGLGKFIGLAYVRQ
jgi:tRNA-modifying protein YgfZ